MSVGANPVTRAAALLATDPARAQREATALLSGNPRDPRLVLILASAMRRLGEFDAARAVLTPVAAAFPQAARTQYELGLILLQTGDPIGGEAALQRAVTADPELTEAWRALGQHLFNQGDDQGAEHAFIKEARSRFKDPETRRAADALAAGRHVEAEALLLAAIKRNPSAGTPVQLLAEVLLQQDRLHEAESLFRHCLDLDVSNDGARFSLAMALLRRQAAAGALAEIETLLRSIRNRRPTAIFTPRALLCSDATLKHSRNTRRCSSNLLGIRAFCSTMGMHCARSAGVTMPSQPTAAASNLHRTLARLIGRWPT